MRVQRSTLIGIATGIAMATIWGVQVVVSRVSVLDGLTAGDVAVLRYLVAGLVLAPVAFGRPPFPVGPLGWRRGLILTCLAGIPYSLLLIGGIAFTPALHGAVVAQGLIPLFAMLIGLLFLGERPSPARLGSLALVLAGVGLFAWEGLSTVHAGAWRGHLLFAAGALLWAVFGLVSTRWRIDPLGSTATISLLSLATLPLVPLLLPMRLDQVAAGSLMLQALYQGLLVGIGSLVLYARTAAALGPTRAAMFIPLVPVISCLTAAVVLGERPTGFELAGMVAVMIGLALTVGR